MFRTVAAVLVLSASVLSAAAGADATVSVCERALLTSKLFDHRQVTLGQGLSPDRAKSAQLMIEGAQAYTGTVKVSPAKNAYLPILAATLLNRHPVTLLDIPDLRDMETTLEIFRTLGVKVTRSGRATTIDASSLATNIATCDLVKTMRASILVLGPLLARFQGAKVGLPGGCPIGARPIDIHLAGLRQLGAIIDEQDDHVLAGALTSLKGAQLKLPFPSVGATQNLIMAATLAEGRTEILNAAREPEVEDLIHFLNAMGARIQSEGKGTIIIDGVKELQPGVTYRAIGDRIEAATYIIGGLMAGTQLKVEGFNPEHIRAVTDALIRMGAWIEIGPDYVRVLPTERLLPTHIETAPHPGFPTDVQAQMMALMTQADGVSTIKETIFETRFQHADELNRMGANISYTKRTATINGPTPLKGAEVRCTDLRGGAALAISALIAEGPSRLSDIYHIERGYSDFVNKLASLGACKIKRVE